MTPFAQTSVRTTTTRHHTERAIATTAHNVRLRSFPTIREGGTHRMHTEIQQFGHEVRLIAPIYVKAFAKRHKSDARDAAAIVEAAQRPTMRFVAVKTKQAQARSMVYRTRGLLVR